MEGMVAWIYWQYEGKHADGMDVVRLTKLPTLPSWVTRTTMRSAKAWSKTSVCTPSSSLAMLAVWSIVRKYL